MLPQALPKEGLVVDTIPATKVLPQIWKSQGRAFCFVILESSSAIKNLDPQQENKLTYEHGSTIATVHVSTEDQQSANSLCLAANAFWCIIKQRKQRKDDNMTRWYLLLVLPVAMLSGVMIWNSQIMETLESIVVKNPLAYSIWDILNNNKDREFGPVNIEALDNILNAVKESNDFCQRRKHMAMATGLVNGYTLEGVQQPHFLAETKIVKAGSDNGALVFVPNKISICAGDSITW